ncbi:uracil-DNA glycosylase [Bacteroidia bacterium]|nr:uracil-DNA glycosylase [Bacteroidia bacterium]
MNVNIEPSWGAVLQCEFEQSYFEQITNVIKADKAAGRSIYPPGSLIFNAFAQTTWDNLRVVLLGQDPYPRAGHAHGLSFSVPRNIRVVAPHSLVNIFKELREDVGIATPSHGCLEAWAKQGVLLLNSVLTFRPDDENAHKKIGWQRFTDVVIKKISDEKSGIVFLLWGKYARSKKDLIDTNKHFVLESAHPSPLAGNAFLGCRHFSKTNELLQQQGLQPIDWNVV